MAKDTSLKLVFCENIIDKELNNLKGHENIFISCDDLITNIVS